MIIALNVEIENTYHKIFETIKYAFNKLNTGEKKKGRPFKYSDVQIIACEIYGVRNSIFSLRELEYKINRDPVFKYIIGIDKAPNYSTLSRFNNRLDVDSIKLFERINELLLDKIYEIKLPK